jgi:transposase-like protein
MMAKEVQMTRDQREIHRKKRIIEYAERIGNINKACRYFGIARSSFYVWRDRYREFGDEGLKSRRCCPHNHPNKTPDEVVEKILHLRRTYPMGPIRIAWYMERYHDIKTSDATVYRVCKRHGMARLPNRVGRRAVHTHRYEKQVPGHHV